MQFVSFRIQNYKGIHDLTLNVDRPDPRVFSLIGLNESGKTTILEAINYFIAADVDLQKMYNIEATTVDKADFVPKSKKANFNGTISISARLRVEKEDLDALEAAFVAEGYHLERASAPGVVSITHQFQYKNSNFSTFTRTFPTGFKVRKAKSQKSVFVDAKHPAWKVVYQTLAARLPQICYFPTFLFELPDKIYIEPRPDERPVNAYYRQLLQDILDSLDEDLSIQTHIVDRIRSGEGAWSWFTFLQTDQREQVNHVLLKASTRVTKVIMESWQRVFNKAFDTKRIDIEYGHDANEDSIYIKLFLVDIRSAEKYEIGDRSLGFRWFFCFWLFTYFRTLRSGASGIVFLLDEPASNLHARAQEELLANIEGLASGKNTVIYSTHSHYLVNPRWLDSAYIVSNGALSYSGVADEFMADGETNIQATTYKQFIGKHPDQRTYFLPVLDALDYKPSELTLERPTLLVEGKADFAFLKLAWASAKLPFSVVPGNGAKSLTPLIGMLTGWGFPFVILLDDDKEGRDAKAKYEADWRIDDNQVRTLAEFGSGFSGKSLEKILQAELQPVLEEHFGTSDIKKVHTQTYLYEKLSSGKPCTFTDRLNKFAESVLAWTLAALKNED